MSKSKQIEKYWDNDGTKKKPVKSAGKGKSLKMIMHEHNIPWHDELIVDDDEKDSDIFNNIN